MPRKSLRQVLSRQFIRHPTGMPIQFAVSGDVPPQREHLRNVSKGGLCFCTRMALEPGYQIHLKIPVVDQLFEAEAVVTWCSDADCGFEIGVRFIDSDDVFSLRMVEQLCYIEEYRQAVEREQGRTLSSEEAASEWIDLFASSFPRIS